MRRYLADPDLWAPETFDDAMSATAGTALRAQDVALLDAAAQLYQKFITRPEANWLGSAFAAVIAAKVAH